MKTELGKKAQQDTTLAKVVMYIIGFSMIFPLFGIPRFAFKTVVWGTSAQAHIWFVIFKLVIIALGGLCIYVAYNAE